MMYLIRSTDMRSTAIYHFHEPSRGAFDIRVLVSSPFVRSPKTALVSFTLVDEIETVALTASPYCPIALTLNDNVWSTDVIQFEAR
jgi:hypothetical protein